MLCLRRKRVYYVQYIIYIYNIEYTAASQCYKILYRGIRVYENGPNLEILYGAFER